MRYRLFLGFFKDLLTASKRGFHEMFKKTYGILYEQNAYVFTDFFKELENYYIKGLVSLFLYTFALSHIRNFSAFKEYSYKNLFSLFFLSLFLC